MQFLHVLHIFTDLIKYFQSILSKFSYIHKMLDETSTIDEPLFLRLDTVTSNESKYLYRLKVASLFGA